jgi:hypothetical protein
MAGLMTAVVPVGPVDVIEVGGVGLGVRCPFRRATSSLANLLLASIE